MSAQFGLHKTVHEVHCREAPEKHRKEGSESVSVLKGAFTEALYGLL